MWLAELLINYNGRKPGSMVLLENINAAEVLAHQSTHTQGVFERIEGVKPMEGADGCLVVRPGGIGDLIHLNAVLPFLAARHGFVDVCAAPIFFDVVKHGPSVRACLAYPCTLEEAQSYGQIYWLENSVENSPDAHMVDVFFTGCGFDPATIEAADKSPRLALPPDVAASKYLPKRTTRRRVGFQVKASARARTPTNIGEHIAAFLTQGWEVFVFGGKNEFQLDGPKPDHLHDCTGYGWSILQSAAAMRECDGFVAPDSGLLHVAGAMGIPCVGLFGVIDARHRLAYTPRSAGMQNTAPCAPCNWHARMMQFPPNKSCSKAGRCFVLDSISSKTVVETLERVIKCS